MKSISTHFKRIVLLIILAVISPSNLVFSQNEPSEPYFDDPDFLKYNFSLSFLDLRLTGFNTALGVGASGLIHINKNHTIQIGYFHGYINSASPQFVKNDVFNDELHYTRDNAKNSSNILDLNYTFNFLVKYKKKVTNITMYTEKVDQYVTKVYVTPGEYTSKRTLGVRANYSFHNYPLVRTFHAFNSNSDFESDNYPYIMKDPEIPSIKEELQTSNSTSRRFYNPYNLQTASIGLDFKSNSYALFDFIEHGKRNITSIIHAYCDIFILGSSNELYIIDEDGTKYDIEYNASTAKMGYRLGINAYLNVSAKYPKGKLFLGFEFGNLPAIQYVKTEPFNTRTFMNLKMGYNFGFGF